MNRRRNLFGYSATQARASGHARSLGWSPFQKRIAKSMRKRRGHGKGSGGSADLVSALTNLGYKSTEARRMASRAKGSDFDSKLRSALSRNPRWRKTVDEITDRAKRYRANQVKPRGRKRCAYKHRLNPCKGPLGVNHIDGDESNGEQGNLNWACKRHNAQLAIYHKAMGKGVRTRQYNPGATNLAQYVQAAVEHVRGSHDEGGRVIHETPKAKRRSFAREIAFRKTGRMNPTKSQQRAAEQNYENLLIALKRAQLNRQSEGVIRAIRKKLEDAEADLAWSRRNPVSVLTSVFPPDKFVVRRVS